MNSNSCCCSNSSSGLFGGNCCFILAIIIVVAYYKKNRDNPDFSYISKLGTYPPSFFSKFWIYPFSIPRLYK